MFHLITIIKFLYSLCHESIPLIQDFVWNNNQFLNTDFDGNSSVYNVGVSTPIFDASWQKGGSIEKNWHARKKMHSSNFGDHERGYNINSSGSGPGGSWGANGIYSFGTTKVF